MPDVGASKGKLGRLFGKVFGALSTGGSDNAIGVSIGTSAIKMVELKRSGGSWRLLHYGIIQLPEDAIVNREIVNHVAVSESLKTLVNQLQLRGTRVCTAISGTGLIIKKMSIEVQNPKELQEQIFWEAEQYLPFEPSEVYLDFHLLSDPKDKKVDVILVAAKKTLVDSYIGCIEDGGLVPKVVDTDFFALQNVFEANYPQKASEAACIVDIGASSMKTLIVHNGIPAYTKESVIGGRNLSAEIQKHLNLSYADAETLKVSTNASELPQEVSELMKIMAENLSGEIKRAIDFYNASSSGAPVAYVLLSGGTAKIPDLARTVEETVNLPTQIINPFNSISYDPSIFTEEYISSIAPIAAVPIGLAIRTGKGK